MDRAIQGFCGTGTSEKVEQQQGGLQSLKKGTIMYKMPLYDNKNANNGWNEGNKEWLSVVVVLLKFQQVKL